MNGWLLLACLLIFVYKHLSYLNWCYILTTANDIEKKKKSFISYRVFLFSFNIYSRMTWRLLQICHENMSEILQWSRYWWMRIPNFLETNLFCNLVFLCCIFDSVKFNSFKKKKRRSADAKKQKGCYKPMLAICYFFLYTFDKLKQRAPFLFQQDISKTVVRLGDE